MFEQVLEKMYKDFWYSERKYVSREFIKTFVNSNISHLIIGPRRSGKSTLLYNIRDELLKSGLTKEDFIYVDFSNVNLINFTIKNFDEILLVYKSIFPDKKPIIFLDEIQNIEFWAEYCRNLVDNKYRIFITGSNSNMLTLKSQSALGGRVIPLLVMPVNFKEFLHFKNLYENEIKILTDAKLRNLFNEYLNFGGFPEVILENQKEELLGTYINLAISDIIKRNSDANDTELKLILKKIYENIGNEASIKSYLSFFENMDYNIDKNKLYKYFDYLYENYFLIRLNNHTKSALKTSYLRKNFFVDLGYIKLFDIDDSVGPKLENLVFLELYNKNNEIYYYRNGANCDFIISEKDKVKQCIQVTLELKDDNYDREVLGLTKTLDYYKLNSGLILTLNQTKTIKQGKKTIHVLPVWKWLLQNK
jgi:hypothetical protein